MAHKTMVGGTAYDITGGKTLVGGTGYSIKKGRTLVGGTGYDITFGIPLDPVFSNNDWATIIAACEAKAVPDTWKVADSKPMSIGGTDYQIDIIGKDHDTYTAGGTAPLTFQMHDIYDTATKMNSSNTNSGAWVDSAMRTTHLPALLALLPAEVQAGIKDVNKSFIDNSDAKATTADKLFLLSRFEVFGTPASAATEGNQYAYYANGGGTIKSRSGSAYIWWLRSLRGTAYFYAVDAAGASDYIGAGQNRGVSFAFCF